jgi:hypothetical protein
MSHRESGPLPPVSTSERPRGMPLPVRRLLPLSAARSCLPTSCFGSAEVRPRNVPATNISATTASKYHVFLSDERGLPGGGLAFGQVHTKGIGRETDLTLELCKAARKEGIDRLGRDEMA